MTYRPKVVDHAGRTAYCSVEFENQPTVLMLQDSEQSQHWGWVSLIPSRTFIRTQTSNVEGSLASLSPNFDTLISSAVFAAAGGRKYRIKN